MATLAQIYDWFMTGKKPTQAQFWASWGSFWNKAETIPQSAISNLTTVLNAKTENDQFNAHRSDKDAHAALFENIKKGAKFLVCRNGTMFFSDELIFGDIVIGEVQGQFLNAGTYYDGDVNQLSSFEAEINENTGTFDQTFNQTFQ